MRYPFDQPVEQQVLTLLLSCNGCAKASLNVIYLGKARSPYFSPGVLKGFGGPVLIDEQPLTDRLATLDEIKETARFHTQREAGIDISPLLPRAEVCVQNLYEWGRTRVLVHVLRVVKHNFDREPIDTHDMEGTRPYPLGALPYAAMWPDDQVWLPLLLRHHRYVRAIYRYGNSDWKSGDFTVMSLMASHHPLHQMPSFCRIAEPKPDPA